MESEKVRVGFNRKKGSQGREASGHQRGWQSHTTVLTTQSPATDQVASVPGRRVATCSFTPLTICAT